MVGSRFIARVLSAFVLSASFAHADVAITNGSGASTLAVEPQHRAARVTMRPQELGTRGAYSLAVTSGVMAAGLAANAEIFQMRWANATNVALIRSIRISAAPGTTAFTAGPVEFNLTFARSWSADGGGGTAVVMSSGGGNRKRTDFPLSSFSDTGIRFSATAALTAGTKTLDTNRAASISSFVSSVATTAHSGPIVAPGTFLWARDTSDEYPLLLEQNEGIVIRATVPATGTWAFSIHVEWAEVDPTATTGW